MPGGTRGWHYACVPPRILQGTKSPPMPILSVSFRQGLVRLIPVFTAAFWAQRSPPRPRSADVGQKDVPKVNILLTDPPEASLAEFSALSEKFPGPREASGSHATHVCMVSAVGHKRPNFCA